MIFSKKTIEELRRERDEIAFQLAAKEDEAKFLLLVIDLFDSFEVWEIEEE